MLVTFTQTCLNSLKILINWVKSQINSNLVLYTLLNIPLVILKSE